MTRGGEGNRGQESKSEGRHSARGGWFEGTDDTGRWQIDGEGRSQERKIVEGHKGQDECPKGAKDAIAAGKVVLRAIKEEVNSYKCVYREIDNI